MGEERRILEDRLSSAAIGSSSPESSDDEDSKKSEGEECHLNSYYSGLPEPCRGGTLSRNQMSNSNNCCSPMLPVEILDHILSFLDETSLKAYLVAHPAFSGLVERHLYSHITVSNIDYAPSELARLLSDNPHVANYVHGLCMINTFSTFYANRWQETMALILPKFKNLQRVSWQIVGGWSGRLCEAFINCLRLPSMVGVEIIYAFNFPLSAFVDCTGIKELTLTDSICRPSPNLSLPYLKTLSIKNCNYGLREIVSWAKTLELQSLDFDPWESDDLSLLPQLLQGCTNSLTSLKLGCGHCTSCRDC